MNRKDFKELASIRLGDAQVLLRNGNYEGAYYLCGYVIECGLKACIAKQTRHYDFPPERKVIEQIYQHDLEKLVRAAALGQALDSEMKNDQVFASHWGIVKDWSEQARYEKHNEREAQDLYSAVADRKHGVLRWIKHYW